MPISRTRIVQRKGRTAMNYSVNVDLETTNDENTPGRICRDHPGVGPHYDITIHPPGCSHHQTGRRVNRQPTRFWCDFADKEEAVTWANSQAQEATAQPVRVRWCHQGET